MKLLLYGAWGLAFVLMAMWPVQDASAGDTVETFNVGPSDAELYLGYERLGHSVSAEWVGGYGILPALSIYVSSHVQASIRPVDAQGELGLGLFGTPLDTRHLDLDLGLGLGFPTPGQLQITPSLELNVDAEDQLALCGLYTRVELPSYGRGGVHPGSRAVAMDLDVTVGTYLSVAPGHQLLLEHELHVATGLTGASGLAFGYNVVISETIELLSEVSLTLSHAHARPGVGLTLGFVATLPTP